MTAPALKWHPEPSRDGVVRYKITPAANDVLRNVKTSVRLGVFRIHSRPLNIEACVGPLVCFVCYLDRPERIASAPVPLITQ